MIGDGQRKEWLQIQTIRSFDFATSVLHDRQNPAQCSGCRQCRPLRTGYHSQPKSKIVYFVCFGIASGPRYLDARLIKLRAAQVLLGYQTREHRSVSRIEEDDALNLAEQIELNYPP